MQCYFRSFDRNLCFGFCMLLPCATSIVLGLSVLSFGCLGSGVQGLGQIKSSCMMPCG